MAQYDKDTLAEALKEYYDSQTVHDTVYEDNPWFGMISKEQTGGKHYDFPVQYEVPASRSHDVSKALANKKVSKYVEFNVQTVDDYAAISIGRKIMKQTSKDEYAFFEAQTREIDKMLKSLVRSLSQGLFRNKGASRGKIGAIANGDATNDRITLDDIEEIANFGIGDVITLSANDGSDAAHTLRSSGATIEVLRVDRDNGYLFVDGDVTVVISGAAADDFIFKDGDFGVGISGFDGWCPTSAPSAGESFHGADRSDDVTRLAGVRVSAVGDPVSEAILIGCSRLGREGARPDTVFMGHAKLRDLIIELGNKVEYNVTRPVDATVGFTGVKVITDNGSVTCYADHNCPNKRLYITRKDTWKLIYVGDDVPEIHDEDGSMLCREQSSDGYEVRASYYANAIHLEPNQTAVVTLED